MNRMKAFDVPHKGLRNALSQVSLLTGKTDYTNQQEVEILYKLCLDVFKILTIHATDEDGVTLAELEKRCPGSADHDQEDHRKIHTLQNNLEKLIAKIYNCSQLNGDVQAEAEEFYLSFSEFHGMYLKHIAEEERITQLLLWKYFSDEELASHRVKIMSKNPQETLLIWFRFVLPAQNHSERVGLFSGFKKMASPELFAKSMSVVKEVLTKTEFERLSRTLE